MGRTKVQTNKLRIAEELTMVKSLTQLSSELGIAVATAEVYVTDCLAAGRKLDYKLLASYLGISTDSFQPIKIAILSNEDNKLRTIRDALTEEFSYNQVCFVLACLICELEL